MPDDVASKGQIMSHLQNFRNHNEEVFISSVQTNVVRVIQQMKIPGTKTVDEHYTERKPTCTEVSNLPCLILIIR